MNHKDHSSDSLVGQSGGSLVFLPAGRQVWYFFNKEKVHGQVKHDIVLLHPACVEEDFDTTFPPLQCHKVGIPPTSSPSFALIISTI
jgi:hypothetical protein